MCMQYSDNHHLWVSWHRLCWLWLKSVESIWLVYYSIYPASDYKLTDDICSTLRASALRTQTTFLFQSVWAILSHSFQNFLEEKEGVRGSQSVISSLAKPRSTMSVSRILLMKLCGAVERVLPWLLSDSVWGLTIGLGAIGTSEQDRECVELPVTSGQSPVLPPESGQTASARESTGWLTDELSQISQSVLRVMCIYMSIALCHII